MIRKLLATTAITAMMSVGALAANTAAPVKSDGDAKVYSGSALFVPDKDTMPMSGSNGYFEAAAGQILASTLIGKTVHYGFGDEAESVGEVNDVVMGHNGAAQAVVIGVGGFLGVTEKDVAVSFERVNWVDRDGEKWLMINATKEELEAAPAFDRTAIWSPRDTVAGLAESMKRETVSRDSMTTVDQSGVSAETLIGSAVYGSKDESVGEIGDVLVSSDGRVDAFIIDIGGFLGIGEKPVALGSEKLGIMKDADGNMRVYTTVTAEQLEAYPAFSEQAYRDNPATIVVR